VPPKLPQAAIQIEAKPAPDESDPALNEVATAVEQDVQEEPPQPDQQPEPVYAEEAIQKPEITSVSSTKSIIAPIKPATDDLNWSQVAYQLELNAVARQLVLNSVVVSWQKNHLQLGFLPELEVMLNQDLEAQIKRAIEAKLGLSLNLIFKSQPTLDAETPQQAFEREQEQARQQVILQIRQDPVVQQLNALFGAELLEHSVRKNSS
jgi:hypothetical protein